MVLHRNSSALNRSKYHDEKQKMFLQYVYLCFVSLWLCVRVCDVKFRWLRYLNMKWDRENHLVLSRIKINVTTEDETARALSSIFITSTDISLKNTNGKLQLLTIF